MTTWRIMVVVEDMDYDPNSRKLHPADAGWFGLENNDGTPHLFVDYDKAITEAETLAGWKKEI